MQINNPAENKVLQEIQKGTDRINDQKQRMINLSEDLKSMGAQSAAIQRTGDIKKIGKFNKLITQKTAELSRLRQTLGTTERRDVERAIQDERITIAV